MFTEYQIKFKSLEYRARKIIDSEFEIPKIRNLILKEACMTVRKCIENTTCSNFIMNNHAIATRNNGFFLEVTKSKAVDSKKFVLFFWSETL